MIAQTTEFPTISTMTSMKSAVVMAIASADSDMIDERQYWFRDLHENKTSVRDANKQL